MRTRRHPDSVVTSDTDAVRAGRLGMPWRGTSRSDAHLLACRQSHSGGFRMKKLAITPLLAGIAIAVAPGVANAAVIATWPLATDANDTSGNGHNGAVQNVVFDGSDAAFNGSNTRITVPYSTALSPGAADVTTSLE